MGGLFLLPVLYLSPLIVKCFYVFQGVTRMTDVSKNDGRQLILLLFVVGMGRRARSMMRGGARGCGRASLELSGKQFDVRRRRRVGATLRWRRRTFSRRKLSVRNFDVADVVAAEKSQFLVKCVNWKHSTIKPLSRDDVFPGPVKIEYLLVSGSAEYTPRRCKCLILANSGVVVLELVRWVLVSVYT